MMSSAGLLRADAVAQPLAEVAGAILSNRFGADAGIVDDKSAGMVDDVHRDRDGEHLADIHTGGMELVQRQRAAGDLIKLDLVRSHDGMGCQGKGEDQSSLWIS